MVRTKRKAPKPTDDPPARRVKRGDDGEEELASLLRRYAELKAVVCGGDILPPLVEPCSIVRSNHDALLAEGVWMAVDFSQEKRLRVHALRVVGDELVETIEGSESSEQRIQSSKRKPWPLEVGEGNESERQALVRESLGDDYLKNALNCIHPDLVVSDSKPKRPQKCSGKLDAVVARLRTVAEGCKVLVSSCRSEILDLVMLYIEDSNVATTPCFSRLCDVCEDELFEVVVLVDPLRTLRKKDLDSLDACLSKNGGTVFVVSCVGTVEEFASKRELNALLKSLKIPLKEIEEAHTALIAAQIPWISPILRREGDLSGILPKSSDDDVCCGFVLADAHDDDTHEDYNWTLFYPSLAAAREQLSMFPVVSASVGGLPPAYEDEEVEVVEEVAAPPVLGQDDSIEVVEEEEEVFIASNTTHNTYTYVAHFVGAPGVSSSSKKRRHAAPFPGVADATEDATSNTKKKKNVSSAAAAVRKASSGPGGLERATAEIARLIFGATSAEAFRPQEDVHIVKFASECGEHNWELIAHRLSRAVRGAFPTGVLRSARQVRERYGVLMSRKDFISSVLSADEETPVDDANAADFAQRAKILCRLDAAMEVARMGVPSEVEVSADTSRWDTFAEQQKPIPDASDEATVVEAPRPPHTRDLDVTSVVGGVLKT